MPAAGGTAVQVTKNTQYDSLSPAWSPDGKAIVFESAPAHSDKPASLWTIATPQAITGS
jgi:Tol biopolymer transport system component